MRSPGGSRVTEGGEQDRRGAGEGEGGVSGPHGGEGLAGEQDGDRGDQEALGRVGERMQEARVERPEVTEGVVGERPAPGAMSARGRGRGRPAPHTVPVRKPRPASAITPPMARTASAPGRDAASRPNAMPARWSSPVAITKPAA
jgi:hypothetical protein